MLSNVDLFFISLNTNNTSPQCCVYGKGGPPYHPPLGPHPFPGLQKKQKKKHIYSSIASIQSSTSLIPAPPLPQSLQLRPHPLVVWRLLMYKLYTVLQLICSFQWVDVMLGYLNKSCTQLYSCIARGTSQAPFYPSHTPICCAPVITAPINIFIFRCSLFIKWLFKSAGTRNLSGSVFWLGFPQNQFTTSAKRPM
jgi:hypothetical protein